MHIPLWDLLAMLVRNLVPLPETVTFPLILIPVMTVLSYYWALLFEKHDLSQRLTGMFKRQACQ